MYNLLNPTQILIPKIEALPCNFLGIILYESIMVLGACIYPVMGNCAAVFLINLPSELIVVVWVRLRVCSLSNTMWKAQIDTIVIIYVEFY